MAESVTKSPSAWTSIFEINTVSWIYGNYTYTSDNLYASLSSISMYHSQRLVVKEFNFNIPTDATILGILVEIERHSHYGYSTKEEEVYLTKDGESPVGTNKAQIDVEWPNEDEVASYGGSADLWGTTWTPAEINSGNFGVILRVQKHSAPYVDHIKVTVYYTVWEPSENQPLNLTAQVVAV